MIRINDAHAIRLIAETAYINIDYKIYCIAHYNSEDKLTGGFILTDDNGYSVEMHGASFISDPARREVFWAVFNYIFRIKKYKKIITRIAEHNTKSYKFCTHLGFKPITAIPQIFSETEGLIIMSMVEGDCKFLNIKVPHISFAPIEKTQIVEVPQYAYSQSIDNVSNGNG